jgi:hypothetical protein
MRVAIFGDSFAHHTCDENPSLAWWQILSKEFDITNYGEPGSCLYYSIELFQKHHQSYDKIIFCMTSSGRIMIPDEHVFNYGGHRDIKNMTAMSVVSYLETNDIPEKRPFFKAALDYFTYIQHNGYDNYTHQLMKDDIQRQRPDGLFIDSFSELGTVFDMENKHYGIDKHTAHTAYKDIRHCHMTPQNNLIFANMVKEWLLGNPFVFSLDKFVIPSESKSEIFLPLKK